MKTLTCKQLGGECDLEIHADTSKEMAEKMTTHVMEVHPETAKKMSNFTKEEHEAWESEFHKNFDATPNEESI